MPNRPREVRRPVAVDFFSGAGGLSAGLESAGFDVLCASDYDPVHAATHEFNFPDTATLCGDISRLTASDVIGAAKVGAEAHGLSGWKGKIDLVAGGPPCQGFSFIGKRLIDDERNQLVFHFFRLIEEIRPRYFLMENVPGMASGGQAGVLEQLVENFEGIGYRFPEGNWKILNAADFGVPQNRKRLFLIGAGKGEVVAALPTPTVTPVPRHGSEPGPVADGLPLGPTVWDAIRDVPNISRYSRLLRSDCVDLTDKALAEQEGEASDYALRLREAKHDPDNLAARRQWDRQTLTASARTVHTEKSIKRFRATHPGEVEPISRFYRLPPTGLCNTLRAGTGSERGAYTSPRPIHPFHPRVLSNREAARLHSMPDWLRTHATKWHGFRQVGNAVAPLVGRAVGASIVCALGIAPHKPQRTVRLGDPALLYLTMQEATAYYSADLSQIPAQRRRGVDVPYRVAA
jgi:DNA (cytosine-5)-methyltransferase 1